MDVDTTVATALKFNSDVDGEKSTTYYMLNYSCDSDVRTMKDYTSNAQLTVVRIGENEEITEIIIANGSKVTNCSGNILLDCGKVVESFAYHLKGTALEITTTENSAEGVTMCINTAVSKLSVNGHDVSFSQNESVLTIGS